MLTILSKTQNAGSDGAGRIRREHCQTHCESLTVVGCRRMTRRSTGKSPSHASANQINAIERNCSLCLGIERKPLRLFFGVGKGLVTAAGDKGSVHKSGRG